MTFRAAKFWFLEHIALPILILPLRLLVATWRVRVVTPEAEMRVIGAEPKLLVATMHGMMLHLLVMPKVAARYGRRVVVMTSPSRDGGLLSAALAWFGMGNVRASSKARGARGSLELMGVIEEGLIGAITVDGPRGPCGVAKPGFARIAAAGGAKVGLLVTGSPSGFTFKSWDRAHLPWPFARVDVAMELHPVPPTDDPESVVPLLQARLEAMGREIGSTVFAAGGTGGGGGGGR